MYNGLQKICQIVSNTAKKKKKKKNQILKLLKDQKILKNCLEIIETKQNIYDKTIEKYKRNMSYIQKNNPWLSL